MSTVVTNMISTYTIGEVTYNLFPVCLRLENLDLKFYIWVIITGRFMNQQLGYMARIIHTKSVS